jgi:hypothetical protein
MMAEATEDHPTSSSSASASDYVARKEYVREVRRAVAIAFDGAPAPMHPPQSPASDDSHEGWIGGAEKIGDDFQWQFRASELWVPPLPPPPFHEGLFDAQCAWLEDRQKSADRDQQAIVRRGEGVRYAAMIDGLRRQSARARRLLGSAMRFIPLRKPSLPEKRFDLGNLLCGVLVEAYGHDPRPAFHAVLQALRPVEGTHVAAGGQPCLFDIEGDAPGTLRGWAILHRCPPTATYGLFGDSEPMTWCARQEFQDIAERLVLSDHQLALAAKMPLRKAA